jgi:hypothetical protein
MLFQELFVMGVLVFSLLFMALFLALGWLLTKKPYIARSPYTGLPVRRADGLPYSTKKKVYVYLQEIHQYDNRPFTFKKALHCRETGRLFQDAIDWKGKAHLDWGFLQKRFAGTWISWGSLSDVLKEQVRNRHEDLEGFETLVSSKQPSPRAIEAKYSYNRPGPLYVDISTGILMGWKRVPDTELEVLVVQHPIR